MMSFLRFTVRMAGKIMAAMMAMIEMTMRSSIRVKARAEGRGRREEVRVVERTA
jgi:hypothetical protein